MIAARWQALMQLLYDSLEEQDAPRRTRSLASLIISGNEVGPVAAMAAVVAPVTSVRACLNSSPWNSLTRFLLLCTD